MQVRKRPQGTDVPDDSVACCLCQAPGAAYDLQCDACQSSVPWCVATGRRMQLHDWTQCRHCLFPASLAALQGFVGAAGACPLCEGALEVASLPLLEDPLATGGGEHAHA